MSIPLTGGRNTLLKPAIQELISDKATHAELTYLLRRYPPGFHNLWSIEPLELDAVRRGLEHQRPPVVEKKRQLIGTQRLRWFLPKDHLPTICLAVEPLFSLQLSEQTRPFVTESQEWFDFLDARTIGWSKDDRRFPLR